MDVRDLKIALIGATGLVGAVAHNLLLGRAHPADKLVLMASARSAGRRLQYGSTELEVIEATPDAFAGIDVAIISATKEVSEQLAPEAVKRGCLVIDDSAVFRMEGSVPLVVPEVNGADVREHRGIISIPNCTTTPLVMVLAALQPLGIIKRVIVSTYQAVSGAGAGALGQLEAEIAHTLGIDQQAAGKKTLPHYAYNAIPWVGSVADHGHSSEERKIEMETRKILRREHMAIAATCVRIPVKIGHSEAVTIDFDPQGEPVWCEDVRRVLGEFPGIVILDDPSKDSYPMPITVEGRPEVFVGRIRSHSYPGSISFFLSCDNLLKGAALNALQILDEVVQRDCLKPQPKSKAKPKATVEGPCPPCG